MDNALASEAGNSGSIPDGGILFSVKTNQPKSPKLSKLSKFQQLVQNKNA